MNETLKKNKKGISLMLISSVMVCFGQLLWKIGGTDKLLITLCGFCLYGIGALVMLYAYKFGELSVLQPVLAANFIFSLILGSIFLNEVITVIKVFAVLFIISGVYMIGTSKQ